MHLKVIIIQIWLDFLGRENSIQFKRGQKKEIIDKDDLLLLIVFT